MRTVIKIVVLRNRVFLWGLRSWSESYKDLKHVLIKRIVIIVAVLRNMAFLWGLRSWSQSSEIGCFCEDCDHCGSFSILRNKIPTVRIFKAVFFFRSDYDGTFTFFITEERFYSWHVVRLVGLEKEVAEAKKLWSWVFFLITICTGAVVKSPFIYHHCGAL